jgi:hypothetical protein
MFESVPSRSHFLDSPLVASVRPISRPKFDQRQNLQANPYMPHLDNKDEPLEPLILPRINPGKQLPPIENQRMYEEIQQQINYLQNIQA